MDSPWAVLDGEVKLERLGGLVKLDPLAAMGAYL